MPGARGEVWLDLEGRRVMLFYTTGALREAERSLGHSVIRALQPSEGRDLSITEVAVLLHVGMEHGRRAAHLGSRAITMADADAVIDELGVMEVYRIVGTAIAEVLNPDGRSDGDQDNAGNLTAPTGS